MKFGEINSLGVLLPCGIKTIDYYSSTLIFHAVFLFFLFLTSPALSQTVGETCENPISISELPFSASDLINDYGDDYGPEDFPPLAPEAITDDYNNPGFFLNYTEVVYTYTPTENSLINLRLDNPFNYGALYVFTGCPFESTVGYSTETNNPPGLSISAMPVLANTTYYIVFSPMTYSMPDEYTLYMEVATWDCNELQLDFGTPVMMVILIPKTIL